MSIPQPFEHKTQADCTQCTSVSETPSSTNWSTRAGQRVPPEYGVRLPQISAILSITATPLSCDPTAPRSKLRPDSRLDVDLLDLLQQTAMHGDLALAAPTQR